MIKNTKISKKNFNAGGNKNNSLTDQQETVLKNTLSKSDKSTSVSHQSTLGSKDSERSKISNAHTLKTIENKLSIFAKANDVNCHDEKSNESSTPFKHSKSINIYKCSNAVIVCLIKGAVYVRSY